MSYTIKPSSRFKKDMKTAVKRGYNKSLILQIIDRLAVGEVLEEKYQDHALTGDYIGHRECHIQPDWLLIYRYEEDVLVLSLTRTGSHSDLY